MTTTVCALTALGLLVSAPAFDQTPNPSRQNAVRERSADVMPFDINATTHVFTKRPNGGVQRVVVKTPDDTQQIVLIRHHAEIQYSSSNPKVVSALHEWFDAQLADHGTDAMAGHDSMQHDH
jgi:hypothetical protein